VNLENTFGYMESAVGRSESTGTPAERGEEGFTDAVNSLPIAGAPGDVGMSSTSIPFRQRDRSVATASLDTSFVSVSISVRRFG